MLILRWLFDDPVYCPNCDGWGKIGEPGMRGMCVYCEERGGVGRYDWIRFHLINGRAPHPFWLRRLFDFLLPQSKWTGW